MSKLIRFDEFHFGYLVDTDIDQDQASRIRQMFQTSYPGRSLVIIEADEFIDLTGQYEQKAPTYVLNAGDVPTVDARA